LYQGIDDGVEELKKRDRRRVTISKEDLGKIKEKQAG
jgi:hypothetical protein